jgi:hypothetical protein
VVEVVAVAVVRVEVEVGRFVEVEVGKFEKVVRKFVGFGEESLTAGGVPVGCLGFLGLVCLQGTFLQVPLFLLRSFFYVQWEEKTKRLLKTLPQHQTDLSIHET